MAASVVASFASSILAHSSSLSSSSCSRLYTITSRSSYLRGLGWGTRLGRALSLTPLCCSTGAAIMAHTLGLTRPNSLQHPKISFSAKEVDVTEWKGDILAVGVTEKDMTKDENSKFENSILKKLDTCLGGLLAEASAEEDFTGKSGQSTVLRLPGLGSKRIGLIGLGQSASSTTAFRSLGEAVAAAAKTAQASEVAITLATSEGLTDGLKLTTATAIAAGTILGTYEDNRYKTESKKSALKSVAILGLGTGPELEKKLKYAEDLSSGVIFGKELVNSPANVLTPGVFTPSDELAKELYSASELSGEKFWRMPLEDSYWESIKSGVADMVNTGSREGGAIFGSSVPASLPELFPKSVRHPPLSSTHSAMQEPTSLPPKVASLGMQEKKPKSSSELNIVPLSPTMRTSAMDGYNWRKYGQKQVKSPKGSRSYYKCTYSDCCAKKIECSDHSGHLIEIVNKGMHIHDPPRKNCAARENKVLPSTSPVTSDSPKEMPATLLHEKNLSAPAKEATMTAPAVTEKERISSSTSNGQSEVQDIPIREPELKRRSKENSTSDLLPKSGKKHRLVVHAAGDVGISSDGYRWRKYGQKMVKGNLNPRNYYRCTSAGCPARKHIEIAVDNSNAAIITYKGMHDHDMPVPKRRHGLPSASLVAAASMSSLSGKKGDGVQRQANAAVQPIVASEEEVGGEGMDMRGENAIESARTLLSIGFEIKQC